MLKVKIPLCEISERIQDSSGVVVVALKIAAINRFDKVFIGNRLLR